MPTRKQQAQAYRSRAYRSRLKDRGLTYVKVLVPDEATANIIKNIARIARKEASQAAAEEGDA